jgi:hypothetical protein
MNTQHWRALRSVQRLEQSWRTGVGCSWLEVPLHCNTLLVGLAVQRY